MTIKIAMSANFWNDPKVAEVLHSCDRIYTTQVINYDKLVKEFGVDRIIILSDCRATTYKFFIERELEEAGPGNVEFIHSYCLNAIHFEGMKKL